MEEGAEFSGRTVEDAIAQAEAKLGVRRTELDIRVITQGSRGVFGIGAEPARIVAARRAPPAPVPVAPEPQIVPRAEVPAPVQESGIGVTDVSVSSVTTDDTDLDVEDYEDEDSAVALMEREEALPARSDAEVAAEARQTLQELLESMGFDVEVSIRSESDPTTLTVTGENLGVLIGRRGDNLSALQFMLNLILSRGRRQWPRVIIDIENYRERREAALRSLASRIAYRVQRNGRPFTLEAMPASDRRIIHLTLRDHDRVETYSIGEGTARRVVIAPKKTERGGSGRYR